MKPLNQESASYILADVHPDHHFQVKDGRRIKNLHELVDILKNMDDETFRHHVNDEKNDFRSWIRDIIRDDELVLNLAKSKTREGMIHSVQSRLKILEHHTKCHSCNIQEHIKCGWNNFTQGITLGILLGMIVARAVV